MSKPTVSNPMANLISYLIEQGETDGADLFSRYKELGYSNELQLASDLSDLASTGSAYFDGWKLASRTDTSARMEKRIMSKLMQIPPEMQQAVDNYRKNVVEEASRIASQKGHPNEITAADVKEAVKKMEFLQL